MSLVIDSTKESPVSAAFRTDMVADSTNMPARIAPPPSPMTPATAPSAAPPVAAAMMVTPMRTQIWRMAALVWASSISL